MAVGVGYDNLELELSSGVVLVDVDITVPGIQLSRAERHGAIVVLWLHRNAMAEVATTFVSLDRPRWCSLVCQRFRKQWTME